MSVTIAPSSDDEDPLDLDLFILELEHQIQTRIQPQIKANLDRLDADFQAGLENHPKTKAERERLAQEQADYQRRKERQRFVQSGEAARAAETERKNSAPPARDLAEHLARNWKVQLIDGKRCACPPDNGNSKTI